MAEYENIVLSCARWEELPSTYNKINGLLPRDIRTRMTEIMVNYMASYGSQGLFERVNNRTIAQIITEYQPGPTKCITSGEVGDVRYTVYKKPSSGQGERNAK
jgi:hypothetical protein